MNVHLVKKLLLIASISLTASGIIFLCLSIFTEPKNTAYLSLALGSILLANLFNIIRMRTGKK